VYYEQAFDDQTGRAKGAAVKVINPEWAGFDATSSVSDPLGQSWLDAHTTLFGYTV
jgi:hypothetical protein